jgi:hypothetical protein
MGRRDILSGRNRRRRGRKKRRMGRKKRRSRKRDRTSKRMVRFIAPSAVHGEGSQGRMIHGCNTFCWSFIDSSLVARSFHRTRRATYPRKVKKSF